MPFMSLFTIAAAEIAEQLAAAPSAAAGTWASDAMVVRGGVANGIVHGNAGHDLYGGAAGIAWFLAHHARRTGSAAQQTAARAGLEASIAASDTMLREGQLSLYAGAAGVALAVEEGARAIDDRALRDDAEQLIQNVAVSACTDRVDGADIIGGKAGIIIAMLAFAWGRPRRTGALRPAIRILAEQLVEEGQAGWWGTAWRECGEPGLCGLGHGASGIGWALHEAAAYLGDDRLREVGNAALRFEASRFDRARGSWPDLRGNSDGQPNGWLDAWCHGAIGIGAVRWRLWDALREPQLLAQATAAMGATRRRVIETGRADPGQPIDVTLCHGLGGAAELMLLAYEVTGRDEHLNAARKVGRLILRLRDQQGGHWSVGLPGGRDVPGLFLGRAGIGTTLLRLDDPSAIPSPMLPGICARRLQLATVSHAVTLGITHPR
jgi:lantibiotic modifying enzyme